jgi:flagellar hook assembly protein FlgD
MTSYPNPFDVTTIIDHDLLSETHMVLNIHSINGGIVRRIVDRTVPAGHYEWMWNGRNDGAAQVPAGLYWSVLTTDYSTETQLIVKVDTTPHL